MKESVDDSQGPHDQLWPRSWVPKYQQTLFVLAKHLRGSSDSMNSDRSVSLYNLSSSYPSAFLKVKDRRMKKAHNEKLIVNIKPMRFSAMDSDSKNQI